MKEFIKRIILSVLTGIILFFYSERMFWSWYRPDETLFSNLSLLAVYSLGAFILLTLITLFNIDDIWGLFLAGALFGWFIEGIVSQTMYKLTFGFIPLNISWTALAWHSLITVLLGWFYLTKTLLKNNYKKTIILSITLGFIYGFWAIFWPNEKEVLPPTILSFIIQSLFNFIILIMSYSIFIKIKDKKFSPTKLELRLLLIFIFIFIFFITLKNPIALFIFSIPAILTILALKIGKKQKSNIIISDLYGKIKPLNYLLLFLFPLISIIIYTIFKKNNFFPKTNIIFYLVTTLLGFIIYVISILKNLSKK